MSLKRPLSGLACVLREGSRGVCSFAELMSENHAEKTHTPAVKKL